MESKHKMYRAVTYGNFQLDLPEFNWGVSVSVMFQYSTGPASPKVLILPTIVWTLQ